MKPIYSYALLAAFAAVGQALAVDATTTPVGYVSKTVPAGTDVSFSPGLERDSVLQTVATASSGATLTIKATGITSAQFVYSAGVQSNNYFVRVLSGSLAGQYQTIVGNTATNNNGTPGDVSDDTVDLTLESGLAISGTPSIQVIPFWTLNTLFPAGAGIGATTDPGTPNGFFLRQDQVNVGTDRAPNKLYFYFNDVDNAGAASGWYDNDDLGAGPQNDLVIYPDELYLIRNDSGAANTVVVNGSVPKAAQATTLVTDVAANDNYVAVPFPVDITLVESGLLQTGAYVATTDPGTPIDYVLLYDDSAPGLNKPAPKVYFYFNDVDNAGAASGWYDNDDLGAGPQDAVKLLKASSGFVVRKAGSSAGSVPWTASVPYTL